MTPEELELHNVRAEMRRLTHALVDAQAARDAAKKKLDTARDALAIARAELVRRGRRGRRRARDRMEGDRLMGMDEWRRKRGGLALLAENPNHEKCHACERCATCGAFHPCKRFKDALVLCPRHKRARTQAGARAGKVRPS